MQKIVFILVIGLFLVSSVHAMVVVTNNPITGKEIEVYQECSMWGHYHCMCSERIREAVEECAAWGHYHCICPTPLP